jgi:hypothetical protein
MDTSILDITRLIILLTTSLIILLITSIFFIWKKARDRSEDLYQKLEMASIEFFKWESANRCELAAIEARGPTEYLESTSTTPSLPTTPCVTTASCTNCTQRSSCTACTSAQAILVKTYCTLVLNLFELAIYNFNKGVFSKEVFWTWLPWIYEFGSEKKVKAYWPLLKKHYLNECGELITRATEGKSKIDFILKSKKLNKINHSSVQHAFDGPT